MAYSRRRGHVLLTPWRVRGRGLLRRKAQAQAQRLALIVWHVRQLKRHTAWLHSTFVRLARESDLDTVSEKSDYKDIIDIVVRCIQWLDFWIQRLIDLPAVLLWTPWNKITRRMLHSLDNCLSCAELIYQNFVEISQPTKDIWRQSAHFLRRVIASIHHLKELEIYRFYRRIYPHKPHIVGSILQNMWWSCIRPSPSSPSITININEAIPHTVTSITLLHSVVWATATMFRLFGEDALHRILTLKAVPNDAGIEFHITMRDFVLTPDLWQRLQSPTLADELQMIGGTIEPLTWDTGAGQGVMLRLPWA